MKTAIFAGLGLVALLMGAVAVGHAQADRYGIGTVFIDARDAASKRDGTQERCSARYLHASERNCSECRG